MYTLIARKTLHTGKDLEIGVVRAPDDEHQPLVRPILAHKHDNEQWHLDEVFAGRVESLETRFYLGLLENHAVCNIMVSEHGGTGIVSHVYTVPEHRRKGVARLVMAEQMADFNYRSGRYLTLSTGYDTHPYYLYHSFGFRGVLPESGHMKFARDAGYEADQFRPAGTRVVPADWTNWPALNVLCAQPDLPPLRNVALGHLGPRMFEGAYIGLMRSLRDAKHQAHLLINPRGAVSGYATLVPDSRWRGQVYLFDLFVHPAYSDCCRSLVQAFSLPADCNIHCHVVSDDFAKIDALKETGFEQEATLRKHPVGQGQVMDIEVYTRFAERVNG